MDPVILIMFKRCRPTKEESNPTSLGKVPVTRVSSNTMFWTYGSMPISLGMLPAWEVPMTIKAEVLEVDKRD